MSAGEDVESEEYEVNRGVDRGWSVQSLLVHRRDLAFEPINEEALPHLGYHGTYVAAARWHRPDGSVVAVASVHASPNPAQPETSDGPRAWSVQSHARGVMTPAGQGPSSGTQISFC